MQIRIRDFQVVERADLDLSGIVLVAGKNAQGKSSVLKGVAAVLTGQLQFGLAKKDAKALVRAGAATATAALQTTDATAHAAWPKCEFNTTGKPPALSPFAAGLAGLLDLSVKERAKLLGDLLRTSPDWDDFLSACTDAGIPADIAEAVWKDVAAKGWDAKLSDVAEKGTRFKGQWEHIAGTKFGTEKMKSWRPEGWTDDLAEASIDDLSAEVGEARQELERAIAATAVDHAEIDRLAAACADIQSLGEASLDAQAALTQAEAAYGAAQRTRGGLPAAEQATLLCPCCNQPLEFGPDRKLVKAERIGDDELKKRRMAIADADGKVSNAKSALSVARTKSDQAQGAYQAAQRAERELADLRGRAARASGDGDVTTLREAVATAERRHAALKAMEEASRLSRLITVNLAVQTILAADGLRKAKLVKVLDTFNGGPLRALCEAAGWRDVRIEPDMLVTYDGRPYEQLAGLGPQISSDQFRVYATLQTALAQVQGCQMVILDGADVLDQRGRGGLIKMLRSAGLEALVGMTFSAPEAAPDLQARGMGQAYWIDGGIARPLGEVLASQRKEAA